MNTSIVDLNVNDICFVGGGGEQISTNKRNNSTDIASSDHQISYSQNNNYSLTDIILSPLFGAAFVILGVAIFSCIHIKNCPLERRMRIV